MGVQQAVGFVALCCTVCCSVLQDIGPFVYVCLFVSVCIVFFSLMILTYRVAKMRRMPYLYSHHFPQKSPINRWLFGRKRPAT